MASDDRLPLARKRAKKPRTLEPREPHAVAVFEFDRKQGDDPRAAARQWFGELCSKLMATLQSGDEFPAGAWDRLLEHMPLVPGDTADAYVRRVDGARSVLILVANACTQVGSFDQQLHETAEFVAQLHELDLLSHRRCRFSDIVEHCVIAHHGDPAPLERVLSELDPKLRDCSLQVLRDEMKRVAARASKPGANIGSPLMAAMVSVAIDAFGDRSNHAGRKLTDAQLVDLARKCFLDARSRHKKTKREGAAQSG